MLIVLIVARNVIPIVGANSNWILAQVLVVRPKLFSLHLIQNSYFATCLTFSISNTAQKMKFSIKDLFSKCDQIRRKLRIWSYLLKKSLMGNFIFCALQVTWHCRNVFESPCSIVDKLLNISPVKCLSCITNDFNFTYHVE